MRLQENTSDKNETCLEDGTSRVVLKKNPRLKEGNKKPGRKRPKDSTDNTKDIREILARK